MEAFLAAADGAIGSGKAVAVHCRAGLGRTGTLIALYLMRRHGFGARAAMGWLRIMRPGSVIGVQQRYLCEAERTPAASSSSWSPRQAADAALQGEEVAAGVARRSRCLFPSTLACSA